MSSFSLSLCIKNNVIDWARWRKREPFGRLVLPWAFLFGYRLSLIHILLYEVHPFFIREVGWCALKSSYCTFINLIVCACGIDWLELLTLLIQIWQHLVLSRCFTRDTWPVHRGNIRRLWLLFTNITASWSSWLDHLLLSSLVMQSHLRRCQPSFSIPNLLCFSLSQLFIILKHIILIIFFQDNILIDRFRVFDLYIWLLMFAIYLRSPLFLHLLAFQDTICFCWLGSILRWR